MLLLRHPNEFGRSSRLFYKKNSWKKTEWILFVLGRDCFKTFTSKYRSSTRLCRNCKITLRLQLECSSCNYPLRSGFIDPIACGVCSCIYRYERATHVALVTQTRLRFPCCLDIDYKIVTESAQKYKSHISWLLLKWSRKTFRRWQIGLFCVYNVRQKQHAFYWWRFCKAEDSRTAWYGMVVPQVGTYNIFNQYQRILYSCTKIRCTLRISCFCPISSW